MRMQEKQTRKVIIYTTRSAYGDWKEDNGVRPICVYLTIMPYLFSRRVFKTPSDWGASVEDNLFVRAPFV